MALFGHFKQKPLFNDPFFGELRYYENKLASFYSGSRFFAPLGRNIDVLIDAGPEGPSPEQRTFFEKAERDYEGLKVQMRPFIESEFRNWREDFVIEDFDREFVLVHLRIPNPQAAPLQWDMAFTTMHDVDNQVTLEFEDWQATGILIDS